MVRTSIPLATYPQTIKAVAPLIDAGKIVEAKNALQATLNTLVITDQVISLPVIRAQIFLKDADLLGYGDKAAFKPIYEQLDQIEKKTVGNKSGKGWFDKIKKEKRDKNDKS